MKIPKFIEEIDRLFDEMVRHPWSQAGALPAQVWRPDATHLEVHIPVAGVPCDVAFSVEGQRLTVTARQRRTSGAEGEITTDSRRRTEHTFTLPEDTDVGSLEARFEGNKLRVRIELRARRG